MTGKPDMLLPYMIGTSIGSRVDALESFRVETARDVGLNPFKGHWGAMRGVKEGRGLRARGELMISHLIHAWLTCSAAETTSVIRAGCLRLARSYRRSHLVNLVSWALVLDV